MVKCYHSITLPPYFYHLITVFLIQITWCSFAHHVAESLFHHAPLLEQIVYRLMLEIVHRALAEEGQPRLDAAHTCTQCQITENNQVERDGSSKNGVTAQEVNLDFHRIAHPCLLYTSISPRKVAFVLRIPVQQCSAKNIHAAKILHFQPNKA